jgi:hypothetical protein
MSPWIENLDRIGALEPFEVVAYLRARDWRRTDRIREVATVWAPPSSEPRQAEVIVPSDRSVGDFAIRMAELVRALTVIEERPSAEVGTDIGTATVDVMRLA